MNVHFRNIIENIFIRQAFNKCESLTQSGEVPKSFFIIKLKIDGQCQSRMGRRIRDLVHSALSKSAAEET